MYVILASVRFARSSNKFVSSSSDRTFTCVPADHICDLVSNQESPETISSRNVTAAITLIVSVAWWIELLGKPVFFHARIHVNWITSHRCHELPLPGTMWQHLPPSIFIYSLGQHFPAFVTL